MRIHTSHPLAHTTTLAAAALRRAQDAGLITPHAYFDRLVARGSRSHTAAADVHMVTDVRDAQHRRRPGTSDAAPDTYALTWDEWGWFLAYLFAAAPDAKTPYDADAAAFHARTDGKYRLTAGAAAV